MASGLLVTIVWVLLAVVLLFALFVGYLAAMFFKLYFLLLGSVWRTFEECIDLGYNKLFTATALEVLYDADDLEVRLSDHSRACDDCYSKMCKILVDYDLLEDGEPTPQKEYVLHTFEQECFTTTTAYMFETRLASHMRRRRRRKKYVAEKQDDFEALPA